MWHTVRAGCPLSAAKLKFFQRIRGKLQTGNKKNGRWNFALGMRWKLSTIVLSLSTLMLDILSFQAFQMGTPCSSLSFLSFCFFLSSPLLSSPLLSSNRQERLTHSFQGSEAALMSSWQTEQSSKHSRDGVRPRTHHSRLTEVRGDVSVWWNHYASTSSSAWCQRGPGHDWAAWNCFSPFYWERGETWKYMM